MANRLVSVAHSDAQRVQTLFVDWFLGNFCNFSCSYCPTSLHDGSIPWQSVEVIKSFAKQLIEQCDARGQKVCIQLIGGEVTLIKDLLGILNEITALGGSVGILSNGSRQLSWWREARDKLRFVVLTYHPEQGDAEHLMRVASFLSERIRTHVNVAAPPKQFDQCVQVAEKLEKNCTDISIVLKPMLINFGREMYPYSPSQMKVLQERVFSPRLTREISSVRGEMILRYEDGTIETQQPDTILARNLNRWRGWSCNAGLELLSIKESGEIFKATCHQDGVIGHVTRPDIFHIPTNETECSFNECICQTDIMVSRQKKVSLDEPLSIDVPVSRLLNA